MDIGSPVDLFHGTAWYYARYRPGYSDAFFAHLADRFALDGSGRALDLGCGTGQLAAPLAHWCAEVVGMDPDEEMLAEAAAHARAAGIANVRWLAGRTDDLPALAPRLGAFRLVTMGSSFHWTDQDATLRALAALVPAGGGLVVASNGGSLWNSDEPWQQAIRAVIQRHLGDDRRAGSGAYRQPGDPFEAVIARSPFRLLETYRLPAERPLDADQVVGLLYSTSFCSRAILGAQQGPFEDEVRQTLQALAPHDGRFREDISVTALLAQRT